MRRSLLSTALGLLTIVGSAGVATAATSHHSYATGQLERIDPAAHTLAVKKGSKEMPFTLASDVKVTQGSKAMQPSDLQQNIGQQVRVRYTKNGKTWTADEVQLLPAPSANHTSSTTHASSTHAASTKPKS